ncbi:unnamed protein product [Rotaria sp. Silwood2]|nr:unnamed protein product [Rotaria sp. Silwood2]CAF2721164.1 unnamed protein product [Rotaria sp. Silwood2]CAF3913893.1 unnamed protein product [Rotaria sp. Silwood2]CAF4001942.1 unnamed protein product [Rotaria sp. Silwood2]
MAISVPVPRSPHKLSNSGRSSTSLAEQQQETLRFHIHSLLAERIYPTIKKILVRILAEDSDFLNQAITSLWRWVRKIGFVHKRTSKVVVPLDTSSFMAARARWFAAIHELRNNGSKVFWHDETYCNKNEERHFVWTDETTGIGRMRHRQNKGIHYFSYISTDSL